MDDFSAGSSVGGSDDLDAINEIIQKLGNTNTYFNFVKSVSVEAFSDTYTISTPAADFSLKVDLEGSISDDDGTVSATYKVNDGSTSFSVSDAVQELLTQNETALGSSDMTNAMNEIAGVIKNGDISSNTSIKTSLMTITLKIKSTFEHTASNGKTYSIEYEITLDIHFHEFIAPLPVNVTQTQATDYNNNLKTILSIPANALDYINNLHPDLQFTPTPASTESSLAVMMMFIITLLAAVA